MQRFPLLFAILCCGAFLPNPTPAAAYELLLNNNLKRHDPGRILFIEDARSVEAPKNRIKIKVLPGEKKAITSGNVTTFTLVRKYPRHQLKYEVVCPADTVGSGVVTPLDIHEDKLPGGCKLNRSGHWSKRSGMQWN